MNAIEIIQDALEAIGEYSPGETVTDADAERSLTSLNKLLELWSNQNLACFAFLTQSIVLQNNIPSYTIGPGGDVNGVRPLRIEQVYMIDSNQNRYSVDLITEYDFNIISNTAVTGQIPTKAWYNPQVPLGILNFWPTPQPPLYTAYWTSYLQLTEFPNLYDSIELPLGYDAALRPNLSVALCKYFGKAVPPDVRLEARESLGVLKRKNTIVQSSYYDPAIISRPISGGWDILAGQWSGTNR